jgi:hypothetical protein
MAEFIARSATENVEEILAAEIAGALVVAVSEETDTNRNKKNRPLLDGSFVPRIIYFT